MARFQRQQVRSLAPSWHEHAPFRNEWPQSEPHSQNPALEGLLLVAALLASPSLALSEGCVGPESSGADRDLVHHARRGTGLDRGYSEAVVLPHASSSPSRGLRSGWGHRHRGSPETDKFSMTPSQPHGLCLETTSAPNSPRFTKDIRIYRAPRDVTKSPK